MVNNPKGRKRVNHLYKWLSPGILVKRWLLTSIIGILLTVLGIAIWTKLTPIYRFLDFIIDLLNKITNNIPNYFSGPLLLVFG